MSAVERIGPSRMRPELEIDLYSGRPNPRIPLSTEVEAWLRAALPSLPRAAERSEAGDGGGEGLGYRGLRVTGLWADGQVLWIGRGRIVRQAGGASSDRRLDPRRRIEAGLLRFAAHHLPDAFRALEGYLERLASGDA